MSKNNWNAVSILQDFFLCDMSNLHFKIGNATIKQKVKNDNTRKTRCEQIVCIHNVNDMY